MITVIMERTTIVDAFVPRKGQPSTTSAAIAMNELFTAIGRIWLVVQ